jgi:hypothetical protein
MRILDQDLCGQIQIFKKAFRGPIFYSRNQIEILISGQEENLLFFFIFSKYCFCQAKFSFYIKKNRLPL